MSIFRRMDTCTFGTQRRGEFGKGSVGEGNGPGRGRENPSMKLVMVKLGGGGPREGVDGHKINFSLGAWFSCDEQKDRQEGLFFNLSCTRRETSCFRGKLSAGRRRARS